MRYSYPTPRLVQFDDENALLLIGGIVMPGAIKRRTGENGLHLWVETGDGPADRETRRTALLQFQLLLGILRAYWPDTGELFFELSDGLGEGATRDPDGNQFIGLASIYSRSEAEFEELRTFAEQAGRVLTASSNLANALTLYGRADRNAADYYMIHEYAQIEFRFSGISDYQAINNALGVGTRAQRRLQRSADNLAPLAGGRHAFERDDVPMTLNEQRLFIGDLLRRWVAHSAQNAR